MKGPQLLSITDRFEINLEKSLGKGCYGEVYEGYDKQSKKKIAVKHLNKPQNFQDQIETLKDLSKLRHPYIMGFYGYEIQQHDVYLFVEYCPNGTLTDLIKNGLEEQKVLDLFRQMVQGMCYMNAKNKMHRDLKPDNVLIGEEMDVKISDFGLARASDGIDITGQIGTPLYAAPQVYTKFLQAYNNNCDVWAGGLILHEMLIGTQPFDHIQTFAQLKQEWVKFEKGQKRIEYDSKFHIQWQYITNLMLSHNPKKRPTFHDILELLKKLDDNGTMRLEIQNKKSGIESKSNENVMKVQNYLNFIDQKYDALTNLHNILGQDKFNFLSPALKTILIYMGFARYVTHAKKLIRSLKYKNLKFPNEEDLVDRNNEDNSVLLLIDKYRNNFQAKYTKFNSLIKQKIIPKLFQEAEKDKNVKSVQFVIKMAKESESGTYDIEDTYEQGYLKLLDSFKYRPSEDKLQKMSSEDQGIYLYLLGVGCLNSQFPDEHFMKKDYVKNKIKKYLQSDIETTKVQIKHLKEQIKVKE